MAIPWKIRKLYCSIAKTIYTEDTYVLVYLFVAHLYRIILHINDDSVYLMCLWLHLQSCLIPK